MRILTICYEDMGGYIGGVRQVIEINRGLSLNGHKVELCVPAIRRYSQDTPFKINYIPTIHRKFLQPLIYHLVSFFYLFFICIKFKPDIILTFEVFFTCVPMVVAKIFHLPYIVFVNGDTEDFKLQNYPGFILLLIDLLRNINFKFSDKIITVTETLKDILSSKYKISPDKISIVNNGIDPEVFKPLDKTNVCKDLNLDSQKFYVGFLGGLFPWHGLDKLVKSAPTVLEKYPQVKFIIAGHGPEEDKLITLVEELGLIESFIFYKEIPFDLVPKYLNIFDICILFFASIRKNMGNPIKLYEYLACGKPVIASNLPEYGLFLEKIEAGIAVDSNNPSSIAEALIKITEDRPLREKMSINAREVVVNNFTWHHTVLEIEKYMKEVIS